MKDSILPQLARPCYAIDCDDDSNDDSSLEILPPIRHDNDVKNNNRSTNNNAVHDACHDKKKPIKEEKISVQDRKEECTTDSDDEFLFTAKPMFATTSLDTSQSKAGLSKGPTRKRPLPQSSTVAVSRSTSSLTSTAPSISSKSSVATLSQPGQKVRPPRQPSNRTLTHNRIEADQRKRQEQLARQLRRDQEKAARVRQKEMEKKSKQQEKLQNQQSMGKFAHEEIVVLVDPIITRSNEYGIVTCLEETFSIKEYSSPCNYKKIIQWIRREYVEGGAESAWKTLSDGNLDQLDHIHHLVVIMDYTDFIPLIERIEHDEEDDYPRLLQWLTLLKDQWQRAWSTTKEPRITLMLNRVVEDLDGEWNKQQRKGTQSSGGTLPSDWELRDALLWILVQHQVDCIHCSSHEEMQANLHLFTRGLAEAPYSAQATELECVRKIKPAATVGDDPLLKVQDAWARQLQMIPRVSEPRARNLVQHYPTIQSLWQTYQGGDENSNRHLLNNCFGSQNAQASLSASVYKVMTSQDPKELV